MPMIAKLLALHLPLIVAPALSGEGAPPSAVRYRAVLQSPGGDLPFFLDVQDLRGKPRAWIINGPERIKIPKVSWTEHTLLLNIEHYDSIIQATAPQGAKTSGGRIVEWTGTWKKRVGKTRWRVMAFAARLGAGRRFPSLSKPKDGAGSTGDIAGRWRVEFSKSSEPAVGVFKTSADGIVDATFLTATGDYRYLAGRYEYGRLKLSCFDGAHAFLFDARMRPDGRLEGDFWSGDAWHEAWTARRDDRATLPDGFALTKWTKAAPLTELRFPDLSGKLRSLDDPAFHGKARIIELFGSWCPNCNDASAYLAELDRRYRARGLSIVGLAFELTGDFERDTRQVRRFVRRHQIGYPILIAGLSDKKAASRKLPVLDRVRAYPTTIFLHSDGRVRAVHTGFSGPATGEAYQTLRRRFEVIIEELLEDSG